LTAIVVFQLARGSREEASRSHGDDEHADVQSRSQHSAAAIRQDDVPDESGIENNEPVFWGGPFVEARARIARSMAGKLKGRPVAIPEPCPPGPLRGRATKR
jgi:hypothetical protein